MHSIFLSSNIIVYLFAMGIVLLLQIRAAYSGLRILKYWDFTSYESSQFKLEKESYLVVLIIFFSLVLNIVLVPFFAYSIDDLSSLISGAMCGAGVVSANEFGSYVFAFKFAILFLSGIWLFINYLDIKSISYKYMKTKIIVFLVIFILFIIEFILNIEYLSNIPTTPVLCCSNIYGASGIDSPLPFGLGVKEVVFLFYLLYFLTLFANIQKYKVISVISSGLFLYISYFSVVYFFGTYIYELPTHKCPFCMLQKDYFYVGYILWSSLALGVFFSIVPFFISLFTKENLEHVFKYAIFFSTIFVLLCSFYVLSYYISNGVFL